MTQLWSKNVELVKHNLQLLTVKLAAQMHVRFKILETAEMKQRGVKEMEIASGRNMRLMHGCFPPLFILLFSIFEFYVIPGEKLLHW